MSFSHLVSRGSDRLWGRWRLVTSRDSVASPERSELKSVVMKDWASDRPASVRRGSGGRRTIPGQLTS
eukprot:scaffold55616_cov62-Phaeocystis_antarctica.AAC.3